MLMRVLRPLPLVRAAMLMAAGWLAVLSVASRPLAAFEGERGTVSAAAVDAAVVAPVVRYSVVGQTLPQIRTARVVPLALLAVAAQQLQYATQQIDRVRVESDETPRVAEYTAAPYDATAPPRITRVTSPATS